MECGLRGGWVSRRFTYCRALFDALIYTYPGQTRKIRPGCISPDRYSRERNDTGSALVPRLSRTRGVREIERPCDDPALVIHSSLLPWRQSHPAMRFVGADCSRTRKADPDASGSLPKNRGPDALGLEGRKDCRPNNLGALIFQEHLFAGIGNLHILCIAAILRLRFLCERNRFFVCPDRIFIQPMV